MISILEEGIELANEFNELNEAIFQADFIVHEQVKVLTESAAIALQEGFLGNVVAKVKEYASKAWEWIKKYWEKLKNAVVEMYNRIKERLTGKGKTIPKSLIAAMEIKLKAAEFLESSIGKLSSIKDVTQIATFKKATAARIAEFKKELVDSKKITGDGVYSPTYFDKLVTGVKKISSELDKAAKAAESELKAMEKDYTSTAKDVNKNGGSMDESSKLINGLKAAVSAIRELITSVAPVIASAPSAAAGGEKGKESTSSEDELKNKSAAEVANKAKAGAAKAGAAKAAAGK
jgi:prefoldin subunit 5